MIPGIVAGQAWTPQRLFDFSEQGAWYDISDLSTLFQDTAGTMPVTAAGQSVALVKDRSGNGAHLYQATSADMPTYEIDSNGLPYLSLNGTSQFLATTSTLTSPSTTAWVLGTANVIAAGGGTYPGLWRFLESGGSPSGTTYNYAEEYRQSSTLIKTVYHRYPSAGYILSATTAPYATQGNPFASVTNFAASGSSVTSIIVPGSTVASSGGIAGSGASYLYVGQGASGELMAGRFYGLVFRNAATTAAQAQLLATWLAGRAGA